MFPSTIAFYECFFIRGTGTTAPNRINDCCCGVYVTARLQAVAGNGDLMSYKTTCNYMQQYARGARAFWISAIGSPLASRSYFGPTANYESIAANNIGANARKNRKKIKLNRNNKNGKRSPGWTIISNWGDDALKARWSLSFHYIARSISWWGENYISPQRNAV